MYISKNKLTIEEAKKLLDKPVSRSANLACGSEFRLFNLLILRNPNLKHIAIDISNGVEISSKGYTILYPNNFEFVKLDLVTKEFPESWNNIFDRVDIHMFTNKNIEGEGHSGNNLKKIIPKTTRIIKKGGIFVISFDIYAFDDYELANPDHIQTNYKRIETILNLNFGKTIIFNGKAENEKKEILLKESDFNLKNEFLELTRKSEQECMSFAAICVKTK
ncbi:class I SAM-dependent methyltransferase [Candidatus Micrarchaeota archaeon]|nr:class I SAM-dependent methyltransferase [Candidatus Micrarchaeota archaeon]